MNSPSNKSIASFGVQIIGQLTGLNVTTWRGLISKIQRNLFSHLNGWAILNGNPPFKTAARRFKPRTRRLKWRVGTKRHVTDTSRFEFEIIAEAMDHLEESSIMEGCYTIDNTLETEV